MELSELDTRSSAKDSLLAQRDAEIAALREKLAKDAETAASEITKLNSEVYLLHRELEEILERIREETRRKYLAENAKKEGKKTERSRQTTFSDRLAWAIRENKDASDFLGALKKKSGPLQRRRPHAVFHRERFKAIHAVLESDKMLYSAKEGEKTKGEISLAKYEKAVAVSTLPTNFTFRLVPYEEKDEGNAIFEFKCSPEENSYDDRVIKNWFYEVNRRIALIRYIKHVTENNLGTFIKELLDFICDDTRSALVVDDKIIGVAEALTILKPALMWRPGFKRLALRNLALNDALVPTICEILRENDGLEHIDLSDNMITAEGAALLADALSMNHTLQRLDLSNNQLKAAGVAKLSAALFSARTLLEVNFSGNQVSDEGVVAFCAGLRGSAEKFKSPHFFPSIQLKFNLIGDDGARAIAQLLRENNTITEVELDRNVITDAGMEALCDALQQPGSALASLSLASNQLSTKGALALSEALVKKRGDFTVDLSGNSLITRKGIHGILAKEEITFDYLLFKIRKKDVKAGTRRGSILETMATAAAAAPTAGSVAAAAAAAVNAALNPTSPVNETKSTSATAAYAAIAAAASPTAKDAK
jgi:hypothetical protein